MHKSMKTRVKLDFMSFKTIVPQIVAKFDCFSGFLKWISKETFDRENLFAKLAPDIVESRLNVTTVDMHKLVG